MVKHFFTWGWTLENWFRSTPPGSFGGKCKTSCCNSSGSRMLLRSAVTRGGVRDSPSLPSSRQKRIFSWSPGAPRTSAPQAVTGHGIWGMPERRASKTEAPGSLTEKNQIVSYSTHERISTKSLVKRDLKRLKPIFRGLHGNDPLTYNSAP